MSLVHKLQQFMFTVDNINSFFLKKTPLKKQSCNTKSKKQQPDHSLLIPKFDDTLFWCYYIMKYGLSKYMIINHSFKEEQRVKIESISFIREHKDKLKRGKFKRIKTENDLLYEKKMPMQTFFCLCFMNDLNIVVVDDNKYIERILYEQETVTVLKKHDNLYGIYTCDPKEIQIFRDNYWKVSDFSHPLKKISTYKAKDLRLICKKLNIDIYNNNKILNMKKLYELISQKI